MLKDYQIKNLKILTTPNEILQTKARKVSSINKDLLILIDKMQKVLKASKVPGVGLSAIQLGVPLRIFIAHLSLDSFSLKIKPSFGPLVFINPQIVRCSKKLNTDILPEEKLYLEGCLSVPKIYALIKRPWIIHIKYQAVTQDSRQRRGSPRAAKLKTQNSRFEGFNSTLIQHEIDHLNGILFTERAIKQKAQIYEVGKDEQLHPIVL